MKKTIQDNRCNDREPNRCQTANDSEKAVETDYSRKPLADVIERQDAYELYLDMPGVEQEDLEIVYEQGELHVKGLVVAVHDNAELLYNERPSCSYARSFSIKDGIDPEKITARLENGVVMIELGKTAAELPKRIEVSAS